MGGGGAHSETRQASLGTLSNWASVWETLGILQMGRPHYNVKATQQDSICEKLKDPQEISLDNNTTSLRIF